MQVVACSPVTWWPRVNPRCGDLFLALQHWRLCISHGSRDHVNGAEPCLTDIEWDVKEPLRTTSSLTVTTLSVPIHRNYILHIHAGRQGTVTMAWNFGLKGLGYRSQLPRFGAVSLGKTLHLYVHSLDSGVNGYLVGQ